MKSARESAKEAAAIAGFIFGLALLLVGVPTALVGVGFYFWGTLGAIAAGFLSFFTSAFVLAYMKVRYE